MGKKLRQEIDALRAQLDAVGSGSPPHVAPAPEKPEQEPLPPIADLISAMGAGTAMMAVPIAAYAHVLDRVHNHGVKVPLTSLTPVFVLCAWEMASAFMVAWVVTKLISHITRSIRAIHITRSIITMGIWFLLVGTLLPIIANLPDLVQDTKVSPKADEPSAMRH